jgi:hypothetical protein
MIQDSPTDNKILFILLSCQILFQKAKLLRYNELKFRTPLCNKSFKGQVLDSFFKRAK